MIFYFLIQQFGNILWQLQFITPFSSQINMLAPQPSIRLIQSLHTPQPSYTIYDSTHLIYILDSFIYDLDLNNPDTLPNFLPINHEFTKIETISCVKDTLVILQSIILGNQRHIQIVFQQMTQQHQQTVLKLSLQLVKTNYSDVTLTLYTRGQKWIYLIAANSFGQNQIIAIDYKLKMVKAKGFLQGKLSFDIDFNDCLSCLAEDRISTYLIQCVDKENKLVQLPLVKIKEKYNKHIWIQETIILLNTETLSLALLSQGNITSIEFPSSIKSKFHNCKQMFGVDEGFFVYSDQGMVFFLQHTNTFLATRTILLYEQNCFDWNNFNFSNRNEILTFYSQSQNSYCYILNIFEEMDAQKQKLDQIEQNTIFYLALSNEKQDKFKKTNFNKSLLNLKRIQYAASASTQIFGSYQAMFMKINHSCVEIYSKQTCMCLIKADLKTLDNVSVEIITGVLHPIEPIVVLAFPGAIRIYRITFQGFKFLREISISRCNKLGFNNNGSILTASIIGKNTKINLYKFNLNECEFIEALSLGKKAVNLCWSNYDFRIYAIHDSGYCYWEANTLFKIRHENASDIKLVEPIKGGSIHKGDDSLVLWSKNNIFKINEGEIVEQVACYMQIQEIICYRQHYIISLQGGIIVKNKNFQINDKTVKAGFKYHRPGYECKYELAPIGLHELALKSPEGNFLLISWGKSYGVNTNDYISIDRRNLLKIINKYKQYEHQIHELDYNMKTSLQEMKQRFMHQQAKQQQKFNEQIQDRQNRYKILKIQKNKLEQQMQYNAVVKENQTLKSLKQLQKLYERKLALTTNKLLTSQQINFRNKSVAEQSLKNLQLSNQQAISQIREQYANHIQKKSHEAMNMQNQIQKVKKYYETKLYQLESQNQLLLADLQTGTEDKVQKFKSNAAVWENKFNQCNSKKNNLQEQLKDQQLKAQILRQKFAYLQNNKSQVERRCQHLSIDVKKLEQALQQKNQVLNVQNKRIIDLQKSNEILKHRVLELKNSHDPKEIEIIKMKDNLNDLEEQYDKLLKNAHELEQKLEIAKKENLKLKENGESFTKKENRLYKRFEDLVDKVRETTKLPIQEIRQRLLSILNTVSLQNRPSSKHDRHQSPLGQLNRMRQHLETTLGEVVQANKKSTQHHRVQIVKRNHENAQLLQQINQLRSQLRKVKQQKKQLMNINKNQIQISKRVETASFVQHDKIQKQFTSQTKQPTRTKTRQNFFEKSLFKTYWKENNKRLKTQQGYRRKKSTFSMMRDQSNPIVIEPSMDEIEYLKKIIDQKQVVIQQLLHKLQKSSRNH